MARPRGTRHGLRRGPAHRPQPRLRPSGPEGRARRRHCRASRRWREAAGLAGVSDARQLGFVARPAHQCRGPDRPIRPRRAPAHDRCCRRGSRHRAASCTRSTPSGRRWSARAGSWRSARSDEQLGRAPVLLAAGDGWHPGIVGIVASRLADRYHRPAVVLGLDDGIAKGSARSIRGFDLGAAVIAARQPGLLLHGGGHAMAAGMTVAAADIEAFRRFLLDAALPARGVPPPGRSSSTGRSASGPRGRPGAAGPAAGALRGRQCRAVLRPRRRPGDETRIVGDGHVSCTLTGAVDGRVKAIAFRAAARRSAASSWKRACRCALPAGCGSTAGRAASRPASRSRTRPRSGLTHDRAWAAVAPGAWALHEPGAVPPPVPA